MASVVATKAVAVKVAANRNGGGWLVKERPRFVAISLVVFEVAVGVRNDHPSDILTFNANAKRERLKRSMSRPTSRYHKRLIASPIDR